MKSPRFFRGLRWAASLLVVGLIGLAAALFAQREPWHPLPRGGEVRLEKLGYGKTLTLSRPGLKLYALRDWLGPTFSRLLGPYPVSSRAIFGTPTFAVAFSSRGRAGNLVTQKARCDIDLPGGQTLQGMCTGGGGSGGRMTEQVMFRIAPFSERRLRMRLEVDGKTLHFHVRNPAFVQKAAPWKAEPLPQTRIVHGMEITLERVVAEWTDHRSPGSSSGARAHFSVDISGRPAGKWVSHATTFFDPLGNESSEAVLFNVPVWKVRCSARRNERYPYSDSEVSWLGPVALPGPGEARVIAREPNLLALLGPGHYRVAAGTITAIPAPADAAADKPIWSGSSGGSKYAEIAVTGIQLLKSGGTGSAGGQEERNPSHLLMRDDSGRRLRLKNAHDLGEISLLAAPIAPGTRELEVGRVPVGVFDTDFFIHPPAPPAAEAKGKPRR